MYKTLTNNTYERATKTYEFTWWDNAFNDEEINNIQNFCEKEELEDSKTIGSTTKEDIEQIRKSRVKFFNRTSDTDWIFARLNDTIHQINEKYYNFQLNGYSFFQYTVYDSEYRGKYNWHMDTVLGNDINDMPFDIRETRKLSCVMLLSEPNVDFCGGEFQLYTGGDIETNHITPEMTKGTIICFPSFLIHRVKPVILGVRKSIVIWVTGPKFI